MDPHHIPEDHNSMNASYAFYGGEQDPAYIAYSAPQINNNYQVHAATRNHQLTDLQQQNPTIQSYPQLSLISPHQYHGVQYTSPTPHGPLPISTSPPSPSPDLYDPLSPPVSGSDTSADGLYHHHSNSSGANSPASSRSSSLVHRHIRYNPTPSPTSSSGPRRRGRSHDSDEDDMGSAFVENLAHSRKEATRRQRIEAEQRRRDELRDGYAKLKDVLPVSNQKSSKVSLLERATNHIIALEKANAEMQARLNELEAEMQRLRAANEKISLNNAQAGAGASPGMFEAKQVSPHPDGTNQLNRTREPPSEGSSPSASEGGY